MRQSRYEVRTDTHRATVNARASGHGSAPRRRIATVLLLNIHQVFAIQYPVVVIAPDVSNKHNDIFFRVKMKALWHIETSENKSITTQCNNNPSHLIPTCVCFYNKIFFIF